MNNVVSLGFQEIIDDEEHPDYVELVHSRADSEEAGLSAMGERMAKVERAAQSMGAGGPRPRHDPRRHGRVGSFRADASDLHRLRILRPAGLQPEADLRRLDMPDDGGIRHLLAVGRSRSRARSR